MGKYSLMPSEIARLVYGYILDTGCTKSAQCFLEESPYLKEFAEGIKNGYCYLTKINNRSLIQMLNRPTSECSTQTIHQQINNDNLLANNNVTKSKSHVPTTPWKNPRREMRKMVEQTLTPEHKILYQPTSNQYSPRRKSATPKRLANSKVSGVPSPVPVQEPIQEAPKHVALLLPETDVNSSPMSSSAGGSSEVDIVVQPETIYEELLKYNPLHDKLANTIQKIIKVNDGSQREKEEVVTETKTAPPKSPTHESKPKPVDTNDTVVGNIEKDLLPAETINKLIEELSEGSEFNKFLDMVVQKEIENTPFKLYTNTPNSASSLQTPNVVVTPYQYKNGENETVPVKNLLKDLQTPEKKPSPPPVVMEGPRSSPGLRQQLPPLPPSKIKPIFMNQCSNLKFSQRIKKNQKEVHEALNYSPSLPIQPIENVKNNLTTTIEPICSVPEVTNISDTSNINVQSDRTPPQVEFVSIPSTWSNSTEISQPIITISNNQFSWPTWNNSQPIFLTYPPSGNIYYIDPSQISSSEISDTKALKTGDQNLPDMPMITQDLGPTKIEPPVQIAQSDDIVVSHTEEVVETVKTQRSVPTILSRCKSTKLVKNVDGWEKLPDEAQKASKELPPTKKEGENRRKSNLKSEGHKRRKTEFDNKNHQSNSLASSDQKIKTLLDSDIDKFLVNIHKDRKKENK